MEVFFILFVIFTFGSTIWAIIDAVSMQRYKYKGYHGAFIVFLGCGLLWIVFFPIYLIRRGDIVNGYAQLKPEYEDDPPPQYVARQRAGLQLPVEQSRNAPATRYEKLQKLGELKNKGILNEEEFNAEKSKLMQSEK